MQMVFPVPRTAKPAWQSQRLGVASGISSGSNESCFIGDAFSGIATWDGGWLYWRIGPLYPSRGPLDAVSVSWHAFNAISTAVDSPLTRVDLL